MTALISMRAVLRVGILLLWVGVMAMLVGRSAPRISGLSGLPSRVAAESSESWQGIYGEGKKVGWAHRRRSVTDSGFELESEAVVRLTMMGAPRVVRTHVVARTDRNLGLRDFRFHVTSGTIAFEAHGVVHEDALEVSFVPGDEQPMRIALSSPILLPQNLHEILAHESLETGKILRYSLFDPMTAAPVTVELEVGRQASTEFPDAAAPVFEVTGRFRGSQLRLWIDAEGEVLREEGPLGLTLVREDHETAVFAGFAGGDALDLVSSAAILVKTNIPSPREVRSLDLRVGGIPEDRRISFPPRQTLQDGLVRIRAADAGHSFLLPQVEPRFAAELTPSPFIQSDHPRIRAAMEKILEGETDARRAAHKLLDWVYGNLAKVPVVAVPSALSVLQSLEGDCNEHAVLYTALARAAGLPARVAAGTVYMTGDEGLPVGFYYHAWVEVWLGEWIAVDPTFGQIPADATHVKLLEGGPETHADLLGLIGRLSFEVEDVS